VKRIEREAWAVFLLLFLAGAVAYAHVTTTAEEYSRYNVGWNGTSGFTAVEIRDLTDLNPDVTLLVLAPYRGFTAEDIGHLWAFLESGGRLLIADEEGNANHLLADLGSTMRVRPGNLSSLDRDHATSGLFRVSVVGDDALFAGVGTIRVNRPAAVEGGEPLLKTSPLTWDDVDGDGRPGSKEVFGAVAVCAREGNLTVLREGGKSHRSRRSEPLHQRHAPREPGVHRESPTGPGRRRPQPDRHHKPGHQHHRLDPGDAGSCDRAHRSRRPAGCLAFWEEER